MAWTNGPLVLYHGTTDIGASAISRPSSELPHSIELSKGRAKTDFGRGFYLTTVLGQAEGWANRLFRNQRSKSRPPTCAVVLRFEVDRNQLAPLLSLCFVTDSSNSDYWNFVSHCRNELGSHRLQGDRNYDVVFGPVSFWPQLFVAKDMDQVGFHTEAALKILPAPVLHSRGTPEYERRIPQWLR